MNKIKYICESCHVEWVKDERMDDAEDIVIERVPTCRSCCPDDFHEGEDFQEPQTDGEKRA